MRERYNYRRERADPSSEASTWYAAVEIEFPEGVTRHPRLPDLVHERVAHPTVIDLRSAGLLVAFAIEQVTEVEATQETRSVAVDLLEFLRLPEASLVDLEVQRAIA